MYILKEGSKYTMVDFGSIELDKQIAILESFLGEDDRLLFMYYEIEPNYLEAAELEGEKEFYFQGFCFGFLAYHDKRTRKITENKIADILYKKYGKHSSNNLEIDSIKRVKEKLLLDFLKGNLIDLDLKTKENIKQIIFLSVVNEKRSELEDFINQRTVFVNNEWISVIKEEIINKPSHIIWYEPRNQEEVKKAMDIDEFYTCIVLNKNAEFNNFLYALKYHETASDFRLRIIEKKEGDFFQNVLPKIEKITAVTVLESFCSNIG
jgi:hypothetical protein